MDAANLRQLIGDVFGPSYSTKEINGWLSMRCPLAQWTHARGADRRPSAGISIQPNNTSVFNCMTCHTKLPLQALVAQYAEYTGEDLADIVGELEDEAYLGPRSMPDWDTARDKSVVEQEALDASIVLDLYDSAAGHPYLRKRGISRRTAELLQLKVDPSDPADGEERILFPVFGPEGQLYGMSGRATHKDARLKVRDYAGLKKAYNVLGSHLITQTKPDKIVVVEGLLDYASAWECKQPGVAVMHSTLTAHQAGILRGFGLPTFLFYDNPELDEAGADGVRIASEMLSMYMPVMRVRYPKIWIDDPDERDGGHWLKDPGDLTPTEFEEMIRDARLC